MCDKALIGDAEWFRRDRLQFVQIGGEVFGVELLEKIQAGRVVYLADAYDDFGSIHRRMVPCSAEFRFRSFEMTKSIGDCDVGRTRPSIDFALLLTSLIRCFREQ